MREILFRGKRMDNGEWVEGSLHIERGETDKNGNSSLDYRILGMRGECDYVDPSTVGQFTGCKDKTGRSIFEGDIVKDERRGILGEVVWLGRNPSFVIKDVFRGIVYNDDFWEDLEVVESREILDIAHKELERIGRVLNGVSHDA